MQKSLGTGSELQIRSAIALDHLKNYIYVEADKAAHVKQVHSLFMFYIFLLLSCVICILRCDGKLIILASFVRLAMVCVLFI